MEKEFVPYEIALALKELGFGEPCFGFYGTDGHWYLQYCRNGNIFKRNNGALSPTFSQIFRWFREKYDLTWEHQFNDSNISLYVGEITYPDNSLEFFKNINVEYDGYNKAYEEAELECLKKLIEIAKEQK